MPSAPFWASLAALLLVAVPASAQEESVHLDYAASAGCADRAAFVAEVTSRTTRAHFVDDDRDVRTFKAVIRSQGERTVGSLISNSDQAGAERRVSGKTCAEVVSALALVTALAIDPSASTHPSPLANESSPSSTQKADSAAAAHLAAKPTFAEMSVLYKNSGQPTASSWGLSWGANGEASYGFPAEGAPLTMLGGSVHAETGPWVRERRGPLVRLGGLLLQSPRVYPPWSSQPVGAAVFTLLAGHLALSPMTVRLTGSFELHPWLSADAGELRGQGIQGGVVQHPQDQTAIWVAVGQAVEVRWRLGGSLWLDLELGAVEPLVQKSFVFQHPFTPIRSIPFFEPVLGVGIGGRIL